MRIYGPNGTPLGTAASSSKRTSSSSFSLPADDVASASEARAAMAPKATANIDALLALQGIEEDPTERRRRSVARGKGALDVLDDLKLGLLSGNLDVSTVSRLRDAAANLKSSSGDPGLDAVLSEIELRVEVELAKAGQFWPDPNVVARLGRAARRGHTVTAIARNPDRIATLPSVTPNVGDVFDRAEMAALWAGHDAAVSSIPFTESDPGTLIGAARTGRFRLGTDQLLTDGSGKSWISFADFAVALVDEIERPAHPRQGFTVGYWGSTAAAKVG